MYKCYVFCGQFTVIEGFPCFDVRNRWNRSYHTILLILLSVDNKWNPDSIQNFKSRGYAQLHGETVDSVEQIHIKNESMTDQKIASAEK
jgi:hypothetical protein